MENQNTELVKQNGEETYLDFYERQEDIADNTADDKFEQQREEENE